MKFGSYFRYRSSDARLGESSFLASEILSTFQNLVFSKMYYFCKTVSTS